MRKFLLIATILFSSICQGQTPLHKLIRKKASVGYTDSSTFNFSAAAAAVTGSTNASGDPKTGVRTATDGTTGWGISSIATANWHPYTVNSAYNGSGVTAGNFIPGLSYLAYNNSWFNYDNPAGAADFDEASPQVRITGLNSSYTYDILITGSIGSLGFDGNPTIYRVKGASLSSSQSISANTTNVTTGATFTGIQPDGSGYIHIYVNSDGGSILGAISAIRIYH